MNPEFWNQIGTTWDIWLIEYPTVEAGYVPQYNSYIKYIEIKNKDNISPRRPPKTTVFCMCDRLEPGIEKYECRRKSFYRLNT